VAARALFEAAGIDIVEDVQGDPVDPTNFAKATVLDLLVKYPEGDLDAVWAGWDASALGAFQATQEAGRPEVLVTGVDGQDFARAEVAKGQNWIATVRQDWPTISTTLADIIDAYFAGVAPADTTVFVPAVLITAENAE
jgi:ribose transport system substrate-binding protein